MPDIYIHPHPDYSNNLHAAKVYINNYDRKNPKELSLTLRGSQHYADVFLTIGFQPPRNVPLGNYANHIWLHQARSAFVNEAEATIKTYNSMINNYKTQQAKELLDA